MFIIDYSFGGSIRTRHFATERACEKACDNLRKYSHRTCRPIVVANRTTGEVFMTTFNGFGVESNWLDL